MVASLCKYLAARFTQISWITSNKIPYIIAVFLICTVSCQILTLFCSIALIGMISNLMLTTVSCVFVIRQYRKLLMVLNWGIVDLQISGNVDLSQRQIKAKQRFSRIPYFFE